MKDIKMINIRTIYANRRLEVIKPYVGKDEFSFYALEYDNCNAVVDLCKRYNEAVERNLNTYLEIGLLFKEFRERKLDWGFANGNIDLSFSSFVGFTGLSRQFAYDLVNVVTRFYDVEKKALRKIGDKNLNLYSICKLIRLLGLSDHQIATYTSPDMSCVDIEKIVARFKEEELQKQKEKEKAERAANGVEVEDEIEYNPCLDESNIPDAYNPKKYYEFSYFTALTKNQLINIVWELQKTYVKK